MPGRFTRPVLAFSALALLAALAPAEGSADDAQPQRVASAHAPGGEGSADGSAEGSAGRPDRRDARAPSQGPGGGAGGGERARPAREAAAGTAANGPDRADARAYVRAGVRGKTDAADEGSRPAGAAGTAARRAGQRGPAAQDVRQEVPAGGPVPGEAPARGAAPARAPHGPELRDNPLFGYDGGRRESGPAVAEGADEAKVAAHDGRPARPAGGAGAAERRPAAAGPRKQHAAGDRVARKPGAAPGLALDAAVGRAARTRAQATADALTRHAERIEQRVAAYRAWGLEEPPPARPAPPVLKPRVRGAKVVRSVPTDDRVVFLTIDDGAMKSPEFLRMVDDLDIPVTSFLADEEAVLGPGYDYFRALEGLGGTTQNHTLHHPYLPALSEREQRREICGQQDRLQWETGGPQPRLFRPPYGAYDRDTLRAARDCGIDAVVLWGMEAWADRIDFQEAGGLYPGAIILTHYRGPSGWGDGGTMVDMLRRVLQRAAKEGYAIGRLEDYL